LVPFATAAFFGAAAFLAVVRFAMTLLAVVFERLEGVLRDGFLVFAFSFLTGAFLEDVRLEVAADDFFVGLLLAADFAGFLAAPLALSAFLGFTGFRFEGALRVGLLAIWNS
jgi:hypothetical protein